MDTGWKLAFKLHKGLLLAIIVLFCSVGVGIVVEQRTYQHIAKAEQTVCERVNKAHQEFDNLIVAQINAQKKALKSNEASTVPNIHKRVKQNKESIKKLQSILKSFEVGPC